MKPSQSIIEEKKSKTRFQVEYFATTGFEVVAPQETDDVKQLKIKMEAHMILGAPSEAPSGTFESRDPVHAPQQPPTMPGKLIQHCFRVSSSSRNCFFVCFLWLFVFAVSQSVSQSRDLNYRSSTTSPQFLDIRTSHVH
eukprot:c11912_g1_i2.p1 GENE.c11912_g1_i2~~c11912_g1_i2.p1  ORF type:complete len:139 (+),score=22.79 c11912_g1_i2:251-667(+)